MNIYDVSKKANVSIATVSRVLNGSTCVSEKTRARVLAVMEESGYTPNVFARGLGLNTMKTVGIMCADSSDPYLAQAVYHIEQDLRAYNYDSLLCCTGYELSVKQSRMNLLLSKRVDGVILVGSNYIESDEGDNAYIRDAAQTVPCMLVNGVLNAPNAYCTVCDDFHAIYDLTDRFLKNGRKRVLYLYDSHSYSGIQKLSGFRAAMNDNSVAIDEALVCCINAADRSVSAVRQHTATLLRRGIRFDGVITSNDILAVGALKALKAAGRAVPADVFVAGYNNFDIAQCCDPELTSVDNQLAPICHTCVATLMDVLEGKAMPKKTVFSADIIERETTKFV